MRGTGRARGEGGGGPPRRGRREAAKTLLSTAAAGLVVLAARSSLADHYTVPTGSMLPTVAEGDRIVVRKDAYGIRLPFTSRALAAATDPRPGDVVVLISPADGATLLKRVVAGPGDEVEVRGGRIVLNGVPAEVLRSGVGLVERLGAVLHPVRLDRGGGPDLGPLRVPSGRFLVMGDNRGDSRDGRAFGLVPREAIRGRAVAVYHRASAGFVWREL